MSKRLFGTSKQWYSLHFSACPTHTRKNHYHTLAAKANFLCKYLLNKYWISKMLNRKFWRIWTKILNATVFIVFNNETQDTVCKECHLLIFTFSFSSSSKCGCLLLKLGTSKLWPAGQIRAAKPFHQVHKGIYPMRKNKITTENLLIW